MIAKLSLLVAAVAMAACAPIDGPSTPGNSSSDGELSFSVVAEGNTSPVGVGEFVYRDSEAWRAVQESLRNMQYEPSISREAVLVVAIHAPTGGYSVKFDSVRVMDNGDLRAHYTVHQPGGSCMVTQALTEPFQIIAIPDEPAGDVEFVERRETYECEG